LSKERFRSISLTKRPKLRKRSISDSNLISENKVFLNNISEGRLRSYTTVSKNENVDRLRKRSISEIDLHRVNIVYGKPNASVSNRNTRCFGVRDKEEGDVAKNPDQILKNYRDLEAKLKQLDGKSPSEERWSKRRQSSENCDPRTGKEDNQCADIWISEEDSERNRSQADHDKEQLSDEVEQNRKTNIKPPKTPPEQRKRKHGFSSFSLTKFMTGKIRTRLRSYEPDDPRQLIIAIRNRDINRVRYILEQCPVDVNGSNSKGVTAVHEAALDGQCDMIELLLKYRAAVNQRDKDGLTSLDYAVFGGHFECAAYLIDNGAKESSVRDGMPAYFKTNDSY